ncbi:DUF4126 family protein [Palleronia marisminoris]|uniref:DUF4126 family protein n=1 Tax=Palleronia marisminoris TaxID=315423 RepID=UPI001C318CD5|nr:DUF4126 family protein [Palleronia marisminoris]
MKKEMKGHPATHGMIKTLRLACPLIGFGAELLVLGEPIWLLAIAFEQVWRRMMLSSFLMGLIGGQRAMTPLAAVAVAAATNRLRSDNGAPHFLSHPLITAGAVAFAIAEMAGDKQKTAPDRIVPIGITARVITSAIAGASLATRRQRWLGAAVGGATAGIASYPGWRTRVRAMEYAGQTSTGFLEDAAVLAGATAIIKEHSSREPR